ncbi:unnamed protein product [Rotaria socialis]|uniref:Uncharacterized protein n=1 Tax=Rotaria socialis TaxID=392032 RepID=A0A818HGA7_9BILA|nr:unnamed protein product [Rotaria socialis]
MTIKLLILLTIFSTVQLITNIHAVSSKYSNFLVLKGQNVTGNRYENPFFGISIEKPNDWHSKSFSEIRALLKLVQPLSLASNNKSLEQKFKNKIERSIPIFNFVKNRLSSVYSSDNPSILVLAEKLEAAPDVKNSCDYIMYSREMLQNPFMKLTSTSDCHDVNLNGEQYGMQEQSVNIFNSININQTQYVKFTNNDFILCFTLNYFNDDTKNEVDNIMRTIKFSKELFLC